MEVDSLSSFEVIVRPSDLECIIPEKEDVLAEVERRGGILVREPKVSERAGLLAHFTRLQSEDALRLRSIGNKWFEDSTETGFHHRLFAYSPHEEPVGFVEFVVAPFSPEDADTSLFLGVQLELVFVDNKERGRGVGIALAIACADVVYMHINRQLQVHTSLDIVVDFSADFESTRGEQFCNTIAEEIDARYDGERRIKEIICDWGY